MDFDKRFRDGAGRAARALADRVFALADAADAGGASPQVTCAIVAHNVRYMVRSQGRRAPGVIVLTAAVRSGAVKRNGRAEQRATIACDAATGRADRLRVMRDTLGALAPGGRLWSQARTRDEKRACKSRARAIAHAIERGEY